MPGPSDQKPPLTWSYLAGWFDISGALYEKKKGQGQGEARLRFSSYDRAFLEEIRSLAGGGSITGEAHAGGRYFRLTVTGYGRLRRTLTILVPYLRKKRLMVERWLLLHQAGDQVQRLKRELRMKPGKFVRFELLTKTKTPSMCVRTR